MYFTDNSTLDAVDICFIICTLISIDFCILVWTGLLFWSGVLASYGGAALLHLLWFGSRKVRVFKHLKCLNQIKHSGNFIVLTWPLKGIRYYWIKYCNALSNINARYFVWVKRIHTWVSETVRLISLLYYELVCHNHKFGHWRVVMRKLFETPSHLNRMLCKMIQWFEGQNSVNTKRTYIL